jgi:hypothetical protein
MTATVNSSRASNQDPMRVKVWVDEEEEGHDATIFVNISATEAPTASNPYGQFRLDFCGKADEMAGMCMMQGFLRGSNGALDFYQSEQGGDRSSTVALRLTSIGTSSGSGRLDMTRMEHNGSQETSFPFAYNETNFLRGDQCFSRDASDPDTGLSVWRYGLYDSVSGERITRNSGFRSSTARAVRPIMAIWVIGDCICRPKRKPR